MFTLQLVARKEMSDTLAGYTIVLPFATMGLFVIAVFKKMLINAKISKGQIISLVLSLLIHYGYSIFFVLVRRGDTYMQGVIATYFFALPIPAELIVLYRLMKLNKYKFKPNVVVVMTVGAINILALFGYIFAIRRTAGGVLLIITITLIYITVVAIRYVKNNFYMRWEFAAFNILLYFLYAFIIMIACWTRRTLSPFASVTIMYQALCAYILGSGIAKLLSLMAKSKACPVLVSSWLLPLIRYNPSSGNI